MKQRVEIKQYTIDFSNENVKQREIIYFVPLPTALYILLAALWLLLEATHIMTSLFPNTPIPEPGREVHLASFSPSLPSPQIKCFHFFPFFFLPSHTHFCFSGSPVTSDQAPVCGCLETCPDPNPAHLRGSCQHAGWDHHLPLPRCHVSPKLPLPLPHYPLSWN